MTTDAIEQNIFDIAGIRIICSFKQDIYKMADLLLQQDDIKLVEKKDYIKHPKESGYRSLHLIVEITIFLENEKRPMKVEVQFRTIAMDFWASLEHDIRYKADKSKLPDGINDEMLECAGKISEIDKKMQDMYKRIKAAESNGD